jgi:hypothetical protein
LGCRLFLLILESMPEPHATHSCHLNRAPSRQDVLDALQNIETYLYDVHEVMWLARCRDCGQLYFCEWRERITFGGGEDQQDDLRIPVATAEEALALSKQSPMSRPQRPTLVMIFPPADAKPYWVNR